MSRVRRLRRKQKVLWAKASTKVKRKLQSGKAKVEEIPKGGYCYEYTPEYKCCPYWSIDLNREHQDNGYCKLLEIGDWQSTTISLIWDQVKECGIADNF